MSITLIKKLLLTGYVFLATGHEFKDSYLFQLSIKIDCWPTWVASNVLTICSSEDKFQSQLILAHSFNQHNRVVIRSSKIWKFSTGTWRRNGCCSRGFSSCLTRRCWRSWDRPRTLTLSRRTFSPCSTTSRRSNSTRNSTRSSSPWRHPREKPLMWVPKFFGCF